MPPPAPSPLPIDRFAVRERAVRTGATTPRPFLRWAGSKRALLAQFVDLLPQTYVRYIEPFVGGGSLFFALRPQRAILADSCSDLIETYQAVRDDPDRVLEHISAWVPDKAFFYALRANRSAERFARAAEFIYLNKTCWNGLYRVNSAGVFNVPYGAPKTANIVDAANLRACGKLLRAVDVDLRIADFRESVATAGPGDLVFLDPPYVTRHNNNGFIDYNETLFSWEDQIAAAEAARVAAERGAAVIATNAHHREVIDLYAGFEVRTLARSSTIASTAAKRSKTQEAIFWKVPA